jgi:hypothetical protein
MKIPSTLLDLLHAERNEENNRYNTATFLHKSAKNLLCWKLYGRLCEMDWN